MLAGTTISFSTLITAIYPLFKDLCMPLGNRRALSDLQHRPEALVMFFGWVHQVCDRSLPEVDLLAVEVTWDLVEPVYW